MRLRLVFLVCCSALPAVVAQVTTFAGGGSFVPGRGVLLGTDDVYFTDPTNHVVRRFNIPTGSLQTIAGLSGSQGDVASGAVSRFTSPQGICTDGTSLFVADTGSNKIKKLTPSGSASFYAGGSTGSQPGALDGPLLTATFNSPSDCAVIATAVSGVTTTKLYVVESTGNRVRVLNDTHVDAFIPSTASTAAGTGDADGTAASALFNGPTGICTDGTNLFVADTGNNKMRKIVVGSATVSTWGPPVGITTRGFRDGAAAIQRYNAPTDCVGTGTSDTIYVADRGNHRLRRVSGTASATVAGALAGAGDADATDGTVSAPAFGRLWAPISVVGNAATPTALFALEAGGRKIRTVTLTAAGAVTAVSTTTTAGASNGAVVFPGYTQCCQSSSAAYFCTDAANHVVRKVAADGDTVFAGAAGSSGSLDATGAAARFSSPWGIACDGTNLFVTDSGSGKIRKIVASSGVVTSYLDASVVCTAPTGIALAGAAFAEVYVVCDGKKIIKLTNSVASTAADFAGTGTTVQIGSAAGNADYGGATTTIDATTVPMSGVRAVCSARAAAGTGPLDTLIVPDTGNHRILSFALSSTGLPPAVGKAIVFAGVTGSAGDVVGTQSTQATPGNSATNLRFASPNACAANAGGDTGNGAQTTSLVVVDAGNNKVKRIAFVTTTASRVITTIANDVWGATAAGDSVGTASVSRFTGLIGVFRDASPTSAVVNNVVVVDANGVKSFAFGSGSSVAAFNGGGASTTIHSCVKSTDYYCSDPVRHAVWKITVATGVVTLFAGTLDTAGAIAGASSVGALNAPTFMALATGPIFFVYCSGSNAVHKLAADGTITLGTGTVPSQCTAATVGQISAAATTDVVFVACGSAIMKMTHPSTYACAVGASSDCGTAGVTDPSLTTAEVAAGVDTSATHVATTAVKLVGVKTVAVVKYAATDDSLLFVHQPTSTTGTLMAALITGDGNSFAGGKSAKVAKYGATGGIDRAVFVALGTAGATVADSDKVYVMALDGRLSIVLTHATTTGSRTVTTVSSASFGVVSSYFADGTVTNAALPLGAYDSASLTLRTVADASTGSPTATAVAAAAGLTFGALTSTIPAPSVGTSTAGLSNALSIGTDAQFRGPTALAQMSGYYYVSDSSNHVIRKINVATGAVSLLAGMSGVSGDAEWTTGENNTAKFNSPTGLLVNGTWLYVADSGNNKIKRITLSSSSGDATAVVIFAGPAAGTVTVGDAVGADAAAAAFSNPLGLASVAEWLIVADSGNHKIKKVSSANGGSAIVFGPAAGTTATGTADGGSDPSAVRFSNPQGLSVNGSWLWVADTGNHKIRRCNVSFVSVSSNLGGTSCVTHIGPPGGVSGAIGFVDGLDLTAARLSSPSGLVFDQVGNLIIADTGNQRIRRLLAGTGELGTLGGSVAGIVEQATAPASSGVMYSTAQFSSPKGLLVVNTETLLVADSGNDRIRSLQRAAARAATTTSTVTGTTTDTPTATVTATATPAPPTPAPAPAASTAVGVAFTMSLSFEGNWTALFNLDPDFDIVGIRSLTKTRLDASLKTDVSRLLNLAEANITVTSYTLAANGTVVITVDVSTIDIPAAQTRIGTMKTDDFPLTLAVFRANGGTGTFFWSGTVVSYPAGSTTVPAKGTTAPPTTTPRVTVKSGALPTGSRCGFVVAWASLVLGILVVGG